MTEEFYSKPDQLLTERKIREYKELYIDKYFPKDKTVKVLDLGCSYCLFLAACKKLGYTNYEGVDFDSEAVNYATEEFGLTNIFKDDIFSFLSSRPNGNYDIITAFNLIEHVKKEQVMGLLSLISDKIKRGGCIYIEVPNGDSPIGIHTFYSDITHEFAYTEKLMRRILKVAGFEGIKVMPNRVRSNFLIRLAQKVLAKIVGFDDKMMFSGNLIVIGRKK